MLGRPSLTPDSVFAGQFRVVRPIAAGGMGTVYLVEQLGTGQQRALKVMNTDLVHDPRARERFSLEAQMAAKIESEHVAQVLAAGIDPAFDTPWMLLELLRGEDLSKTLDRRGQFPLAEVRELLKQLGHALAAAHRQGIVHRDLKPENVFIAESRRSDVAFTVKVLDFGIAKWLQENQPSRTTSVLGSPLWMAPEQLDTALLISPATDVWALGLLTFTMITGISYWKAAQRASITLPALLAEISMEPLVPASQRAAEGGRNGLLPPAFDGWFGRCVARDPRERFVDATQALAGLDVVFPAAREPVPERSSVPATVAIPVTPMPMPTQAAPVSAPVAYGSAVTAWAPPTQQPHAPMPSGTAMMPSMAAGVPPWMVGGGPAPTYAPPPRRKSGSGTAVFVGLGALLVVGGAVAGVAWWTSQCDTGYHDSSGHCCATGAEWEPGRGACVSTTPPVITATPVAPPPPAVIAPTPPVVTAPPPVVAQPATTITPVAPPPVAPPHACVGTWRGRVTENTGAYGALSVTVREGGSNCGEWRERWDNSGLGCAYRFVDCRYTDGIIRGTGVSSTPRCTSRVNAMVRCGAERMSFRESTSNGVIDTATLQREN